MNLINRIKYQKNQLGKDKMKDKVIMKVLEVPHQLLQHNNINLRNIDKGNDLPIITQLFLTQNTLLKYFYCFCIKN